MSTTDEQRLREADSWFAAFEEDKVWDKATARACFIAGHALGHQAAPAQQAPTPAVPEPPSVHQALLDSLSALLDEQRELPTNKRISLDYRESIEAAINKLAKLPRIKS